MMKPLVLGSVAGVLFPSGVAAQTVVMGCNMGVECLEQEACSETSVSLLVLRDGESPEGFVIESDAETLKATGTLSETIHLLATTPSAAHLLTVYPDMAARYTVHLEGPYSITYHGQCEAPE